MKSLLLWALLQASPIRPEPVVAGLVGSLHISLIPVGNCLDTAWKAEVENILASGQPVSFGELEGLRQPVSPGNDGGRVIEELRPVLGEVFRDRKREGVFEFDRTLPPPDFAKGLSESSLAASRAFLERHAVVAHQLRYLMDTPYGRYVVEHDTNPIMTVYPHLLASRVTSQLLCVQGVLYASERNVAGTLQDVTMLWHLANTFIEEPMGVNRVLMLAAQQRAILLIEAALRVGRPDDDTLRLVAEQVNDQLQSTTLQWSLWGERAFHVEMCEALLWRRIAPESFSALGGGAGPWWYSVLSREPAVVRANQWRGARLIAKLMDAQGEPPALLREARALEMELASLPPWQFMTRMNLEGLPRTVDWHVRGVALLRCAQAGVAAERHRLRTGRFPDRLSDLVPTFLPSEPLDPFDGKPLRLKSSAEGVTIYSIGQNLVDDAGDVHPIVDERSQSPDVGFRLFWLDQREKSVTN